MKKEDNLKNLTPLQYEVTQNDGTEPAFSGIYDKHFESGIYVDIVSKEALFVSTDKFDSGCGWPAFSKPITDDLISETLDHTNHRTRMKVDSKNSNTHLGHVFDDGPQELGGLRYCINSASLEFIKKEDMIKLGYEKYLPLVK